MKKIFRESFVKAINSFPENILFLLTSFFILIIPAAATIGQYLNTGFFIKKASVLLFYWPGSDFEIKVNIYVWIFMSFVFITFLAALIYLFRNKSLGKVILFTILIFLCATLIKTFLSEFFGWKESGLPNLSGRADSTILALWHNPIWEEIVFRGIPLLILLGTERYITGKRTPLGIMLYCLVPAVICGLYHIPGHGIIRFFDTIIISAGFSLMTMKFSFMAPVAMHYIADAMMVLSLNKIPSIEPSEIEWISKYGYSLNSLFFLGTLFLIFLIPVLVTYYFLKFRKKAIVSDNMVKTRLL